MFTKTFWRATLERALSTGAQAALLAWGGGFVPDVRLPWWTIPAAFAGGAVLSVLKGLAAHTITGTGPSMVDAEVLTRPRR